MDISQKPLPRMTPDTEPFWQGCRRYELLLAQCNACTKVHLPPGPVCPFCFSDDLGWRQASGRGNVSAWTVVHKDNDKITVGMAVEVTFDDVTDDVTLPRFRPLS
jgi:uncharacterized OB-fold protein